MKRFLISLLLVLLPLPAFAAITFDAAVDGGVAVNTVLSWSHTSAGADRIAFVGAVGDLVGGADDVSSITWGGNAMTFLAKMTNGDSGDSYRYLYYIIAPPTGSQTITITFASSHAITGQSVSYAGASQTGQPDASITQLSASINDLTLTTAITTVADNSWAVLYERGYTSVTLNSPPTAGAGATRRVYEATVGVTAFFDSNGPKTPAGSYSMTTDRGPTTTGSVHISHIVASFKPAVATAIPVFEYYYRSQRNR